MSTIANIIWIIFGGLVTAIGWCLAGIVFSVTIIGIPLGRQCFKMASLTLAPFGKTIVYGGGAPSLIANIFWLILAGLPMAVSYAVLGVLYCITVIGIPIGLQCLKMAKLSLFALWRAGDVAVARYGGRRWGVLARFRLPRGSRSALNPRGRFAPRTRSAAPSRPGWGSSSRRRRRKRCRAR